MHATDFPMARAVAFRTSLIDSKYYGIKTSWTTRHITRGRAWVSQTLLRASEHVQSRDPVHAACRPEFSTLLSTEPKIHRSPAIGVVGVVTVVLAACAPGSHISLGLGSHSPTSPTRSLPPPALWHLWPLGRPRALVAAHVPLQAT